MGCACFGHTLNSVTSNLRVGDDHDVACARSVSARHTTINRSLPKLAFELSKRLPPLPPCPCTYIIAFLANLFPAPLRMAPRLKLFPRRVPREQCHERQPGMWASTRSWGPGPWLEFVPYAGLVERCHKQVEQPCHPALSQDLPGWHALACCTHKTLACSGVRQDVVRRLHAPAC